MRVLLLLLLCSEGWSLGLRSQGFDLRTEGPKAESLRTKGLRAESLKGGVLRADRLRGWGSELIVLKELKSGVEALRGGEDLQEEVRQLVGEGVTAWDDLGESKTAMDCFSKALALDPLSADAWCSMGVVQNEAEDDFEGASEAFKKALECDPKHIDTLHFFANMLYENQEDNQAEKMYKYAIECIEEQVLGTEPLDDEEFHPLYVDTLCNYGGLLERVRGNTGLAEDMYRKALKVDPMHSTALFNYGVLLEDKLKKFDEAEVMYLKALESDPDDVSVMINLALLNQNVRQQYGEAEKYFERAMKVNPDRGDLLTNYAIFLEQVRKDFEGAEEAYKRSLEAEPDEVTAMCHFGSMLKELGREKEGEAMHRQARELDEETANICIDLRRQAMKRDTNN